MIRDLYWEPKQQINSVRQTVRKRLKPDSYFGLQLQSIVLAKHELQLQTATVTPSNTFNMGAQQNPHATKSRRQNPPRQNPHDKIPLRQNLPATESPRDKIPPRQNPPATKSPHDKIPPIAFFLNKSDPLQS